MNQNLCREKNHNWRGGKYLTTTGYILALNHDHPRANKKGYVRETILIAEKALGKFLPELAEIHHINGIRNDNRPENLVICQDQSYHKLLHLRERAIKVCGYVNWRKCCNCFKWDNPEKMIYYLSSYQFAHRNCKKILNKTTKGKE